MLQDLVHLDPALEAHPQIDRRLLARTEGDASNNRPPLRETRRRAYFEWSAEEVADAAGDPQALALARGRHLQEFRELAIGGSSEELARRLCAGISRLETLPPVALDQDDAVPLKITPRTPTETAFWVEKSIGDFRLEADSVGGEGLGRLHRQAFLVYSYRDGREERLRLGAELFHLLLELGNGYQLGDIATDDVFANLAVFVQRLLQEDNRRMLAWNPMEEGAVFEIAARMDDTERGIRQRLAIRRRGEPEA